MPSVICETCGNKFDKKSYQIRKTSRNFCNKKCSGLADRTKISAMCANCNAKIEKLPNQKARSKTGRVFCSKSCAATYNNTHKTHGTRRSKLEQWLEVELRTRYPNLELLFNKKDAINSELDIHAPSLNFAVELNGICHYEPIYGTDKLLQIQNNDTRKFQACLEKGIELMILDVSSLSYFKPTAAQKYFDMITSVLDEKLNGK